MNERTPRLSEEDARQVWERAVELHAAAADRQTRQLSAPADSGKTGGYDIRQVREAAAEVGIAPEYVARALVERREANAVPSSAVDRWAERLSGGPDALVAIRRFDAPIGDVQKSVQTVFPSHRLTMIGIDGDPLDGGTQTFGFRDTATVLTDPLASDLMTRAHVEELHLSLLPIDGGGCVAALSAPLTAARRAQLGSGVALAAGGGLFGGWAISGIAAAIVLPLGLGTGGLLWIAGAAALGAGGGGGLGVAGSRARHLALQRRGRSALERLLQEVDLAVRTGRGPTEVPD